jgi:hypothetical protein
MTAVRFQIVHPSGEVLVDNGMLSFPAHTSASDDAKYIADDLADAPDCPAGVEVRLWKDVDLVGPVDSQGEPHAVAVTR